MALTEEQSHQLRQVFDVCDEEQTGVISLNHLLQLAGDHFGSSQNSVTAAVTHLGVTSDVVTFPQFCDVVLAILQHGGSGGTPECDEDTVDCGLPSKEQNPDGGVYTFLKEGDEGDCSPPSPPSSGGSTSSSPRRRRPHQYPHHHRHRRSRYLHPGHHRNRVTEVEEDQGLLKEERNHAHAAQRRSLLGKDDLGEEEDTKRMRGGGSDRVSNSPSASLTDLDSALGGSTASPASTRNTHSSGCSSMSDREENFECYGEGEDIECDSDSARIGDDLDGSIRSPPHSLPPNNFTRRNSWMRRSLRSPSSSSTHDTLVPPRRWGSFRHAPKRVGGTTAVASQLYRTSSFSSGRSSAADQDEMYSDASLEDDVLDLNQKVQMLQQQVGVLAENQVNSDDRFSRVKQDNAALQARVLMLEEQLRESEMRSEDRLSEEQRRNRELITRIEREKQLTVENYTIKLASIDKDKSEADGDIKRMKAQLEKLQKEKSELEDRVSEAEFSASAYQQENSKMAEMARREKDELKEELERSSRVIEELRCEVERLRVVEEAAARKRSPSIDPQAAQQNSDLQETIRQLREENKSLQEQVEDLQAQLLTTRLEEGRNLVTTTNNNSLAAEFEAMTNEEGTPYGSETVEKLKKSLKDAQEANQHLRSYIDGILLNIVENYPQLLEVKQK